jgi:membrane protease YdiL (CAAX protease family)
MASDFPSFDPTGIRPSYEDELPPLPEAQAERIAPTAQRPPQPGFWLSAVLSGSMLFLCQLMIPLVLTFLYMIVSSAGARDPGKKLGELSSKEAIEELNKKLMLPLLVAAHVPTILLGLVALRIFAGRQWYREIAVRLPSLPHFLLLLLGFPALPFLAGGAYWLAQKCLPGLGMVHVVILSLGPAVLYMGLIWVIFRFQRGHDPKLDLAKSPMGRQFVIGSILAVFFVGTAFVAYQLFARFIPSIRMLADLNDSMEQLVEESRSWHPLVAVLVVAVMPAFSEEIWCRGFLGRGLIGQYGAVCGVMITSFFFGAMHLLPHQGAMAMMMGLVLHYAYITTRSFLAPMLLHFLNNATSVLGSRLGEVAEQVDVGPEQIPLTLYGCAALLFVAAGWALYQSRARVVYPEDAAGNPYRLPPYPGVALPPPNSGAVITKTWPSLAAGALTLVAFLAFATVFGLATYGIRVP